MNCLIKKKWLLLGLLSIFSIGTFAQRIEIKGCIIEETEGRTSPVGFANISLLRNDSTLVIGTSSNINGEFHLKNINSGDYLLASTFTGYDKSYIKLENLSNSIHLGNIKITPSLVNLSEVTVSASHYINQINRKIIFPDENQIKKSTDGMDLLRNLLLSGVEIDRLNNTVKGARGGVAEIRINGAKVSDQKEIMAIQPKDIIRIEYHDEPSLRYGESEVVIDYIVRRKESGGSAMVYGQKGMPGNKAYGFSMAKLNYKKSEFSVLGGINYYSYKDNYRTNQEAFKFKDGHTLTRIENGLPAKKRNNVSTIEVGYNFLEIDKHFFVLEVGVNQYYSVNNTKSLLFSERDKENATLMTDYNKLDCYQPYAVLYYQFTMKNKQLLVFDATGYFSDAKIGRTYTETRQGDTLTDIITNINENRNWFTGEAFYEKTFEQGRFNIGVKHTRTNLTNNYSGDFITEQITNQASTYFYAEWMGHINKFTYAGGIGGTQVHLKQNENKSDQLSFTPNLRLGYQFNSQFQVRYNGKVSLRPPLGIEMNAIDQAIDSLQIRRGNPFLKPSPYYNNMLTISFDKKPINVNLQIVDNYHYHPVMESIFEENGRFIHQMENQKYLHQVTTTGYAKAAMFKETLSVYVRGGLNHMKSKGDTYNHVLNNWFISGGIDYTWKKWNPFWEIESRKNRLSGETINYSNQATTVGLRYKLKEFSTSAYFKHSIGWDTGRENLNQYASNRIYNYSPSSKNMLFVNFIWNFQFGRKYNGSQKKINNSDDNSSTTNLSK